MCWAYKILTSFSCNCDVSYALWNKSTCTCTSWQFVTAIVLEEFYCFLFVCLFFLLIEIVKNRNIEGPATYVPTFLSPRTLKASFRFAAYNIPKVSTPLSARSRPLIHWCFQTGRHKKTLVRCLGPLRRDLFIAKHNFKCPKSVQSWAYDHYVFFSWLLWAAKGRSRSR